MNRRWFYLWTVVFIAMSSLLKGQTLHYNDAEKLVSGSKIVRLNEKNKTIQYIQLKDDVEFSEKSQSNWLKKALKLTASHELKEVSKSTDKKKFTHVKYQIYYKNLPIEGAFYSIHSKNGKATSASGSYILGQELNVNANITEKEAFTSAMQYVNAKEYKWDQENTSRPTGQKVIFIQDNSYILAYKFDIYAVNPLSRQYIFISANTGAVLNTYNRIHNSDTVGTAETLYNGIVNITTDSYSGQFRLREAGRGQGIETYDLNRGTNYASAVDFTDADNYWNTTSNYDNAAYDAHFAAEATYDYFYDNFGRNSYDDNGSKLISYIHYGINYVNAFWNGEVMTYGDGDGVNYLPLTPIEVVAHELTHGITEYSAGLIYANESGALNESFSDIFGIVVDFEKNPATANYEMGDAMSPTHTPFRSMQDPNAYGCPDTYLGDYWDPSEEVHTNSGVQNYWFYLLAEGGSGINDNGDSFTVTGIGRDKAAQVSYQNLNVYLSPNSDYADARFYAIQSAIDLFGDCSPEVVAVTNAWYAVGVGEPFDGSVFADFYLSTTEACQLPTSIYFYNKSSKATSYIWDFGDGTSSTDINPSHIYTNADTYTVSLIASGSAICTSSDTIVFENLITTTAGDAPAVSECIPFTNNPGEGGIYEFNFNTISNTTAGSIENYQDYTCSQTTTVIEGRDYDLNISVGTNHKENVAVWLDLNNDGQFVNEEIIFKKDGVFKTCSTTVNIPGGAVFSTPLRLRVKSDYFEHAIINACDSSYFGQVEDYSVTVEQNTNAPEALFSCNKTDAISGDTLEFIDQTLNLPTSWLWNFEGGEPASSTEQNPRVTYSSPGIYNVTLTVDNAFGTDALTKTGFITVTNAPPAGLKAVLVDENLGVVKLNWLSKAPDGVFENFNDGTADNFLFPDARMFVDNGELKATASGDNTWVEAYYDQDFQDFTMEYSVKRDQGDMNTAIGMLFRSTGSMNSDVSGYLLCMTTSGSYSVWKMTSGNAINLIGWTSSSAINTGLGNWNNVTIEANGSAISIFFNGEYVNQTNDATYSSGRFNFGAYLSSGYTHEISWDNFSIIPQAGIIAIQSNKSSAINTTLSGTGSINFAPKNTFQYKPVEVKRLIGEIATSSKAFQAYNLYRNSSLLKITSQREYFDTLSITGTYGTYQYTVTSQYDDGESEADGPVSLTWFEPNIGENCDNAQDLSLLTSPYDGTTADYLTDFYFCGMGSSPDRIFYADLYPADIITIGQSSNNYDSYHSLRVGGACPGNNQIICIDDPDIQMHTYTNNSDSIQRVYWIQAGYISSYGNFKLSWNIEHVSCPKPTSLSVSNVSYTSATLNWVAGYLETEWAVEWGEAGFEQVSGTLVSGITADSLNLTGLLLGTQYDFYVKAICDVDDESAWSGPYTFSTLNLAKPTGLTANLLDAENGIFELTWQDGSNQIFEDFEDGLSEGWTPVSGNWLVENGTYACYNDGDYIKESSAYNNNFEAFELEVTMTSTSSTSDYLGLFFNGDPSSLDGNGDWSNCYMLMYSINGYVYMINIADDTSTSLYSGYSDDIITGTGVSNTLKVVYSNGFIDCYVNGVLQASVYDNSHTSGSVGLHSGSSFNDKTEFDNFTLKPISPSYTFGEINQPEFREAYTFNYEKNTKDQLHQVKAPVIHNITPVTKVDSDSKYFKVYRNDKLIDTTSLLVNIDTLDLYGNYEYKVSAVYPEGESQPAGPISVEWFGNPVISVSPTSFNETVLSGDSITKTLTISNTGSGMLIFDITSKNDNVNFNSMDATVNSILLSIIEKHKITIPTINEDSKSLNISEELNYLDKKTIFSLNDSTITFNEGSNGLILGGRMLWNNTGGGHLFCEDWNNDDYIYFPSPVYIKFFEMNAFPYEGYTGGSIGKIDINGYDINNTKVWETTIDLSSSTDWLTWVNVNVETDNISYLEFKAPGGAPWYNGFWPSIDNIHIGKNISWLTTNLYTDTLSAGESVNIDLKFNAKDLSANHYYDTLIITSNDLNNPQTIVSCELNVVGKPTPIFNSDLTEVIVPESVQFTDMSIGDPTSWKWILPGATPSISFEQNPLIAYNTPGTYDVSLIVGNAYGADTLTKYSFITAGEIPSVSTVAVYDISSSFARSGGNVISDGMIWIIEKGVCWNSFSNPTIDNSNRTIDGSGSGDFNSTITGLTPNATYHVRAYIRISTGVIYGEDISFVASTSTKPSTVIRRAANAPVIDGFIDPVWSTAIVSNINLPFRSETPTLGESGTTIWKGLWTNEGIYILVEVNDDVFSPVYDGTSPGTNWMYDKPEIYIDVNSVLEDGIGPNNGNGHYQFAPSPVEGEINGGVSNEENGCTSAWFVTDPNYVVEYFIPFTTLIDQDGNMVSTENTIGFDVTIVDNDTPDPMRNRAVWANIGSNNESWNNMDDCGTITLVDASYCAAPTIGLITQPTCTSATGSVVLTGLPAGGWVINPGAISDSTSSITISNLVAGIYTYTVTDSAGNTSVPSAQVVIQSQPATPDAPTASASMQPSCNLATGIITITAPSGAGFTYCIDGSTYINTSGVFDSVAPGTYSVTAKNASGCISAATSVTINEQPETPATTIARATLQPTCSLATGIITVTAPSGVGVTYSINDSTYINTSGIFDSVVSGTYSVSAKDASGCISTATIVTIDAQPEVPDAPTARATLQPTCSVETGTITVTAPTGTGLTYSINDSSYTNKTGIFNSLVPGTYSVTAKNASGCISAATSVAINAQPETPAAPIASATLQPNCSVATGTIAVTAPMGTGITYSINDSSYTNTTGIFNSLVAGTYSVTAKNASGCISTATRITIDAQPETPVIPTASALLQPTCKVATGTIVVTAPIAQGLTYSIDNSTYINTTGVFNSVLEGIYIVTAKNAGGCVSSGTSVIILAQPITPDAPVIDTVIQPTCKMETGTVQLSGLPTGNWIINQGTITGSTKTKIISGLVADTYNYTVTNSSGCESDASADFVINTPEIPETPVISGNGNLLTSNASVGNQWYNNQGIILGDTNQNYTATQNGKYYVIVSKLDCSSEPSNELEVILSDIESVENNLAFKVYPNPVSDELIIEMLGNTDLVNFEILNVTGEIVFKGDLIEKTVVRTNKFASGVYILRLETDNKVEFKKIVKE